MPSEDSLPDGPTETQADGGALPSREPWEQPSDERWEKPSHERWEKIERLFHEAAELPLSQRSAYLDQQCGDDACLKDEVLGLLGSNSAVSDLMAAPLAGDGQHLARETVEDRWIGRVLDGFLIESLLGRGGMGVVYLGTRVGDILAQRVAIKLMAQHLQSTPAQSQFQLERDALAALEHPHIAKLVGGGVTTEGLPFVVMEYIEGRRLDAACDDPGVTLEQIARWMLELCDAVSYVHRNLMLHRDLKPGNVMVTPDGGVKLLDFGTLKAIGASAVADSAMTQAGMRPVTLRYASPEHIRGEAGSTALDVYSLGMTLYRLLAGRLPEMEELSVTDYLHRLEQERTPPPSSLRRSGSRTRLPKDDAALIADLDAITLKAIRSEAAGRYEGADAMAADLRRAMGSRPVAARVRTWQYRSMRFVRRNRMFVAGAVATAVVLGAGLVGVAHEASVARAESLRASGAIVEETKLTHFLLFDYFDDLKRIPASTQAQRTAVSQALQYLDTLGRQSLTPALRLDSVRAYTEMGSLEGNPYEENLNDAPAATKTLQKAVTLAQRLLATSPQDKRFLESASAAELALGRVYFGSGDPNRAVKYLLSAADSSRILAATPGMTAPELAQAASVVDSLGDVYGQEGAVTLADPDTAIVHYQQAQNIDMKGLQVDPSNARCRRGVAIEYWKMGMHVEDEERAKQLFSKGLDIIAVFPPSEQQTVRVQRLDTVLRQRVAVADLHDGHTAEGLAMFDLVRQRFRDAVAADPTDARARFDLVAFEFSGSESFSRLDRPADEERADKELLENIDVLMKQDAGNRAWASFRAQGLLLYAKLMMKTGRPTQGVSLRDAALTILVPLAQRTDADTNLLSISAEALADRHQLASRDAPLAISFAERAVAASPRPTVGQLVSLAEAQRFGGMVHASRQTAQRALDLQQIHPDAADSAVRLKQIHQLLLQPAGTP